MAQLKRETGFIYRAGAARLQPQNQIVQSLCGSAATSHLRNSEYTASGRHSNSHKMSVASRGVEAEQARTEGQMQHARPSETGRESRDGQNMTRRKLCQSDFIFKERRL